MTGAHGRFIVVGDVMMDVTARIATEIAYASDTPAQVSMQPGGSASTTAAWMAAAGDEVVFVGCVGDDVFGREVQAALEALGVRTHLSVTQARPTGTCVVIVDGQGERTMFPDTGANSLLDATAALAVGLTRADHVHLSGYTLLNPEARAAGVAILESARAAGASTSLDPASAGPLSARLEAVLAVLPLVDVVLANADEARVLTGGLEAREAVDALSRIVPVAVVKRGAAGAVARHAQETVDAPAHPADVVDTTGAGDAFAAGFLSSWRSGESLARSVDTGQGRAAVAVSRVGGGPPGH